MVRRKFNSPQKEKITLPKPIKKQGSHMYAPWMAKKAQELVGKLGATNKYLALYFGVTEKAIEYWSKTKPEFKDAVLKGRIEAGMVMARSLYKMGTGFEVMSEKIFCLKDGEIIREPYMKYYPPNAFAAHKWLTIMFRDLGWSNNVNVNHTHSGDININHRKIEDIPLQELSKEQQELLFQINLKQLQDAQRN